MAAAWPSAGSPPPGVDLGGVRRPRGVAAAGGVLGKGALHTLMASEALLTDGGSVLRGTGQLQRRALVLRRGQARGRDALLRLPPAERRRHPRRAHLQHLRDQPPLDGTRWPHSQTSPPAALDCAPHPQSARSLVCEVRKAVGEAALLARPSRHCWPDPRGTVGLTLAARLA